MNLSPVHHLTALIVFRSVLNQEVVRSLHTYRLEDGNENEIEREYLFSSGGSYAEMIAYPILKLQKFRVVEGLEGRVTGTWLCIFAFSADCSPILADFPSVLSISRNLKLRSIPTLFNDLQLIHHLSCSSQNREPVQIPHEIMCENDSDAYHQSERIIPVLEQDLNHPPLLIDSSELSENQQTYQAAPGDFVKKKRRATTKHVAKIALEDLAKHFDHPIAEASRKLKVGLSVLKRKCREFGIPRWPHRKIKSLDSLIHNLREEAERQQEHNLAAATAVVKRQRMLESEKEIIERKPVTEILGETKRFRQDVFKRRHRARALKNQCQSSSP